MERLDYTSIHLERSLETWPSIFRPDFATPYVFSSTDSLVYQTMENTLSGIPVVDVGGKVRSQLLYGSESPLNHTPLWLLSQGQLLLKAEEITEEACASQILSHTFEVGNCDWKAKEIDQQTLDRLLQPCNIVATVQKLLSDQGYSHICYEQKGTYFVEVSIIDPSQVFAYPFIKGWSTHHINAVDLYAFMTTTKKSLRYLYQFSHYPPDGNPDMGNVLTVTSYVCDDHHNRLLPGGIRARVSKFDAKNDLRSGSQVNSFQHQELPAFPTVYDSLDYEMFRLQNSIPEDYYPVDHLPTNYEIGNTKRDLVISTRMLLNMIYDIRSKILNPDPNDYLGSKHTQTRTEVYQLLQAITQNIEGNPQELHEKLAAGVRNETKARYLLMCMLSPNAFLKLAENLSLERIFPRLEILYKHVAKNINSLGSDFTYVCSLNKPVLEYQGNEVLFSNLNRYALLDLAQLVKNHQMFETKNLSRLAIAAGIFAFSDEIN